MFLDFDEIKVWLHCCSFWMIHNITEWSCSCYTKSTNAFHYSLWFAIIIIWQCLSTRFAIQGQRAWLWLGECLKLGSCPLFKRRRTTQIWNKYYSFVIMCSRTKYWCWAYFSGQSVGNNFKLHILCNVFLFDSLYCTLHSVF